MGGSCATVLHMDRKEAFGASAGALPCFSHWGPDKSTNALRVSFIEGKLWICCLWTSCQNCINQMRREAGAILV